jgi:hypothetical protein
VNEITDPDGVHWVTAPAHGEFYALVAFGCLVAYLVLTSSRIDAQRGMATQEKLDAIIRQLREMNLPVPAVRESPPGSPSGVVRELSYTPDAERSLRNLPHDASVRVQKFLEWLQTAELSQIVVDPRIQKVRSSQDVDFVARLGSLRIPFDLKLSDSQIIAHAVQTHWSA